MPLRLLSLLLFVNFSTLLAGVALADEPVSTPLRGPKSTDTALMQRQLGPLSGTDTLWRIAEQVKPATADVSTYQVMYAIYLKNPDSFIDGNLNHLRPGSTLQLPNLQEIRAIDNAIARAKSDSDDKAWAARTKAASQATATQRGNQQIATPAVSAEQLQELTELKDQFGNSLLMIEAIARENNQLKATLSQVQTELLALQQQLGEDSTLQQQLNTVLQQQADILAAQKAQEQKAAEAAQALAAEQEQSAAFLNNPLVWVLAASIPALLMLLGVVVLLKRRGQQTEAAVEAANSAAAPPADYKSPLPPLDDNNDLDDSGLFDIDESLLDDTFADSGDFAGTEILDDSLPDFSDDKLLDDDALLDDDILLDDDSLLANGGSGPAADNDLLDDVLATPELADDAAKTEFDANNILSDSDLNALLSAEDDDDAIISLDDDDLDLASADNEQFTIDTEHDLTDDAAQAGASTETDEEIIDLDEDASEQDNHSELTELAQPQETAEYQLDDTDVVAEDIADDDLLEEIELDVPDEPEDKVSFSAVEQQPGPDDVQSEDALVPDESDAEQILVETDNSSEQLISEYVSTDSEELTDSQIANMVEDESFDRTELDAFAEALALEGGEQVKGADSIEDDQASELLSAELDELLQQVEAVDPGLAESNTDEQINSDTPFEADETADELADDTYITVDSEGPDLQHHEDDSVTKPSEAALSVENPSKMLESYPELELSDEDFNGEHLVPDEDSVSVDIAAADTDADQGLAKLDDSQFDNLLTELEAMAQTTASDSEELSLDVDAVFSPALEDEDTIALSDADFVEIDNLLASSEQIQEDDGRFEQLNVDVGLDEFADVIGNDNPQDVDAEDNGFAAKLDLVRAYIEIDDLESASQIIAEVLDSDAPEHVKTEAKALQQKAQ